MSGSKTIKVIMLDKGLKVKDLASKLGVNERVLSNKLYRDTFSLEEYIKIADALGCDVKTIARDTNKEYLNERKEDNK
jgi:transcriptional regulator with XRE-family HTH domain